MRLFKDLLSILFFGIAEFFARLGDACEDSGLDDQTRQLIKAHAANN